MGLVKYFVYTYIYEQLAIYRGKGDVLEVVLI